MKNFKIIICISLFLLSFSYSFSQKQNDNWFFGKYVGINFNASAVNGYNLISGSQMEAPAVSAVMSDPITGNLLFYTDGRTVWNKNHLVMNNGSGLRGSPSSAQPAIIVPKPGSNTIYYVFTMSGITNYLGLAERKGLAYSIVDMSLNSGLGGVTTKNVILFSNSDTEMLTSTLGHDGSYYWVVTQKESNFLAYKVSATGVNNIPVTSAALYSAINDKATRGIKISPNSNYLVVSHYESGTLNPYIYTFNNLSGQVLNGETADGDYQGNFFLQDDAAGYLMTKNPFEFSPNSNILYVSAYRATLNHRAGSVITSYKYNPSLGWRFLGLNNIDFNDTNHNLEFPRSDNGVNSLQLSSNGQIMISGTYGAEGSYRDRNYLAYIDNPNNASNIMVISQPNNLSSSTHKIYKGFPQLVYLNTAPLCEENLFITQPITSSQNFQVSNTIEASSVVYQNLNVNFRGSKIILKPGFSVSGYNTGVFRAVVDPCSAVIIPPVKKNSNFTDDRIAFQEPVLFPNPTTTTLSIDNIQDINEWKLVDINGKTVESGNVNNSIQTKISINTSRLMPGVYYFNAVMKNGELFQKTVIKK